MPKRAEFQHSHVLCKVKQHASCTRKLLSLLLELSNSLNAAIIRQSFVGCCWGGCCAQFWFSCFWAACRSPRLPGMWSKKFKMQFDSVSWERIITNVLGNSFAGLGHVGVCHCVATAKLQLHHVCCCAAQCPKSSIFQSTLQSINYKSFYRAF